MLDKNKYTRNIDFFSGNGIKDIETFLGIQPVPENRKDKKPLNVMWNYFNKKFDAVKITLLYEKIKALL